MENNTDLKEARKMTFPLASNSLYVWMYAEIKVKSLSTTGNCGATTEMSNAISSK